MNKKTMIDLKNSLLEQGKRDRRKKRTRRECSDYVLLIPPSLRCSIIMNVHRLAQFSTFSAGQKPLLCFTIVIRVPLKMIRF